MDILASYPYGTADRLRWLANCRLAGRCIGQQSRYHQFREVVILRNPSALQALAMLRTIPVPTVKSLKFGSCFESYRLSEGELDFVHFSSLAPLLSHLTNLILFPLFKTQYSACLVAVGTIGARITNLAIRDASLGLFSESRDLLIHFPNLVILCLESWRFEERYDPDMQRLNHPVVLASLTTLSIDGQDALAIVNCVLAVMPNLRSLNLASLHSRLTYLRAVGIQRLIKDHAQITTLVFDLYWLKKTGMRYPARECKRFFFFGLASSNQNQS